MLSVNIQRRGSLIGRKHSWLSLSSLTLVGSQTQLITITQTGKKFLYSQTVLQQTGNKLWSNKVIQQRCPPRVSVHVTRSNQQRIAIRRSWIWLILVVFVCYDDVTRQSNQSRVTRYSTLFRVTSHILSVCQLDPKIHCTISYDTRGSPLNQTRRGGLRGCCNSQVSDPVRGDHPKGPRPAPNGPPSR